MSIYELFLLTDDLMRSLTITCVGKIVSGLRLMDLLESIGISWPLEVTKIHDRDRCAPTLETMDILPNYNKKSSHA